MVSVNRLRGRKSDFPVNTWIMDSGAFTEISTHGYYRDGVAGYAEQINRWKRCGNLVAAVAQDYMCEPFILARTGLSVADHQRLTIARYDALLPQVDGVTIMPVLQGYRPEEYVSHIRQYGDRLTPSLWVGLGSVCKRNANPTSIEAVLNAVLAERPDLRLHGFGIKISTLKDPHLRRMFHSADSMAWSFAARRSGRDANDWREAVAMIDTIEAARDNPLQVRMW